MFVVAVLLVALALQTGWAYYERVQQASVQMLSRAQNIALELESIGEGDSAHLQGNKGIVCRFTADITRNSGAAIVLLDISGNDDTYPLVVLADDFERKALSQLSEEENEEYYRLTYENGIQVFKYIRLLSAASTGTEKPIWAVSISVPAAGYINTAASTALSDIAMSGLIVLAALGATLLFVRKFIAGPILKMNKAAEQIAAGNFDVHIESKQRLCDEIDDLASNMALMANELKGFYERLEEQVHNRTKELAKANALLEKRTEQLEKAKRVLEDANEELKEDSEYRIKFLSVMSHELRTPLTSILAFLDIWERDHSCVSSEEKNLMREVRVNAKILLDRVNNILEVSRIHAGKARMEHEALDPYDLIEQLEITMSPLAENKQIELLFSVDSGLPIIEGDGEKLLRVLENLCENALKYTQENGRVELSAAWERAEGSVVFSVKDNGRGIDKESLPRIFESFSQGIGVSAHISDSSGLGLAVVRELVEMHGGSLSVESSTDEEHGSIFSARIPVGDAGGKVVHG